MRKITEVLFSSTTTIILFFLFAFSMALATFVEDKFDTVTAKLLVYNSKWFEFIILLLALNFIGHLGRYRLLSMKKAPGLIIHLSFILMIIGAGITRYTGYEGMMHIREGEASDIIYISEPYFQVKAIYNNNEVQYEEPFYTSPYLDNSLNIKINIPEKGNIVVAGGRFIPNSIEKITENVDGGKNIIELQYMSDGALKSLHIYEREALSIENYSFSFDDTTVNADFKIFSSGSALQFVSGKDVIITSRNYQSVDSVAAGHVHEFSENCFYNMNESMIFFTKEYKKAEKQLIPGYPEDKGRDALLVDVTLNGITSSIPVYGGAGYPLVLQQHVTDGVNLLLGYGDKPLKLPFSLSLNDFMLERYPGSMSPSSYQSEVTLSDSRNGKYFTQKIFMNNVLDYGGYRFFQSSYDKDEKGTILSVNHDFWGTWVSYAGYFLMIAGLVIVLFVRNSRFHHLINEIKRLRTLRTTIPALLLVVLPYAGFSAATGKNVVSQEHADKFGELVVQTHEGRFEPVHTLAFDVLHKLSRKDKIYAEGKGELNTIQVFMDMITDPEYWMGQKIIYVRETSVREILGVTGKYASYNDFFNNGQYKLAKYSEEIFRKKQSEQNRFDKEIIRVDERLNVFAMVLRGDFLRIFPLQGFTGHTWVSWNDTLSHLPLTGILNVINEDLQLEKFNNHNVFKEYISYVSSGITTGNYNRAEKILGYIDKIQRQSESADLLPSKRQVKVEVHYNKANVFVFLRDVYGFLSIFLLFFAFLDYFRKNKSKFVTIALYILTTITALAFAYHTYGMILRWYLTGHAPWSNGYEALLLVAWGGVLSGFCFIRYSKITLAATSVLAFTMLMTAGHSSYDPQLTNLVPVLKSYWLIIHVASITVSYGFLGIGFMLGIITMFIFLFKNKKNSLRVDTLIKELTVINEMNLIIGLILATIGTFLGGVWANESWGRYWGWDAKETWALIIIIAYTIVLHLRLIPDKRSTYIFNVGSILSFGTVLMTFIGVNYYLSKGLHSYGAGDTPVFPLWAWIMIVLMLTLIIAAGIKNNMARK